MNRIDGISVLLAGFIVTLLGVLVVGCGAGGDRILGEGPGTGSAGPAGVNTAMLGLASSYGIAANAGVTSAAASSVINGNVVLNPNDTCNAVPVASGVAGTFGPCGGFPPALIAPSRVVTATYPDTSTASAVQADLMTAYLKLCAPGVPSAACTLTGATNLPAGTTLGAPTGSALVPKDNLFFPGVYQSITSIMVTGDLTLDAQGNPNAVFVFQSSSTIGIAAAAGGVPSGRSRILLAGGAKASNVWWSASSDATLDTYSEFQGNIMAGRTIVMKTGATSCGRLLAGGFTSGQFTFDNNVVSVPGNSFAPPATYSTTCQ